MNVIFSWITHGTTKKTVITDFHKRMQAAYEEVRTDNPEIDKETFEKAWKAASFDALLERYGDSQERFLRAEGDQHCFLEQVLNAIRCGNAERTAVLINKVVVQYAATVDRHRDAKPIKVIIPELVLADA